MMRLWSVHSIFPAISSFMSRICIRQHDGLIFCRPGVSMMVSTGLPVQISLYHCVLHWTLDSVSVLFNHILNLQEVFACACEEHIELEFQSLILHISSSL